MGFDNVAAQSAPLTDKVSYIRQGYAPQAVKGSVLLLSGVPYVGQEATNKQKEAMLALREYMDTSLPSELDGLAVTDSFKYIEQYVVILSETLRNLTLAVIAVFLACIIMTGSWALSFVTMLGVISADVWLMGLMAALDIALDSISMINLIMAVGLAADYVLHTSNDILHPLDESTYLLSPNERVRHALEHTGAAVLLGGVTTFLGVMPTGFASSHVFNIFFQMFAGLCAFALFHGLVIIPVPPRSARQFTTRDTTHKTVKAKAKGKATAMTMTTTIKARRMMMTRNRGNGKKKKTERNEEKKRNRNGREPKWTPRPTTCPAKKKAK
eukprot:Selendium_serpulae@DN4792_c2_g1_i8.p1